MYALSVLFKVFQFLPIFLLNEKKTKLSNLEWSFIELIIQTKNNLF